MSSSVFTQIASGSRAARAERLFHAAITAFAALVRPTRAEIAQLGDLTLPLLSHVSPPTLRFAAAALSDSAFAPPSLVRRLCDGDVEIAAPLLMRSPVLDDAGLVELIERHGLPHARAIARRQGLRPVVVSLIEEVFRREREASIGTDRDAPAPSEATENTRRRLRGMMRGGPEPVLAQPASGSTGYQQLRDTALLDHRPFFHTVLADTLGVELGDARRIASDIATLLPALHAAGLSAEQAFLISAAVLPAATAGTAGVRAVLDCYAELDAAGEENADQPATTQGTVSAVFRFKRA